MRLVRLHALAAAPLSRRTRQRVAMQAASQSPLQQLLGASGADGWEQSWQRSMTPWDAGVPAPSLVRLVREGSLPRGRALVPGVGGGYDALALAGATRTVLGVDLSPTAVAIARQRRDAAGLQPSQCDFVAADFFADAPWSAAPFSLIWDYTFFCALAPAMRPAWAARMRQLLAPDGLLVTLIFPVAEFAGGPPFAVSPALYQQAREAASQCGTRRAAPRAGCLQLAVVLAVDARALGMLDNAGAWRRGL